MAIQAVGRVRSLAAVAKFLWPIPDKRLKKRLHRIGRPPLIVLAEHDRLVPPAYGEEFADRIDRACLHIVQNAGHLFPLEIPAEFATLVSDFLAPKP